jgi:hypothetical protein
MRVSAAPPNERLATRRTKYAAPAVHREPNAERNLDIRHELVEPSRQIRGDRGIKNSIMCHV